MDKALEDFNKAQGLVTLPDTPNYANSAFISALIDEIERLRETHTLGDLR